MSQRITRVNELVKREISLFLHTRYSTETMLITILEVETHADLRTARIYYSVLGDHENIEEARRFFQKRRAEIRKVVFQKIILKYVPDLEFIYDPSMERGSEISQILDELEIPEEGER